MVSARPRRMSDVPDPPQPILPIPEGSAFFILSQSNRCDTHTVNGLVTLNQKPKNHIRTKTFTKKKTICLSHTISKVMTKNPKQIYNL